MKDKGLTPPKGVAFYTVRTKGQLVRDYSLGFINLRYLMVGGIFYGVDLVPTEDFCYKAIKVLGTGTDEDPFVISLNPPVS